MSVPSQSIDTAKPARTCAYSSATGPVPARTGINARGESRQRRPRRRSETLPRLCAGAISRASFRSPAGSRCGNSSAAFWSPTRCSSPPRRRSRVAIYNLARTGELWHHIGVSARRVRARLRHRLRDRHRARARHGGERHHETGVAAVGFRALRHADDRAGAAVHSLVRHRHLVEGAGGDHARCCSRSPSTPRPACAPPASG